MINHARSLLLNVDGSTSGFTADLGEEFVPPLFRAIILPGFLSSIHQILFGPTPDRLMLNYRARQYLGMLHTTELVEFVLELDSRITYDTLPNDNLFNSSFVTQIQPLNDTAPELFLIDEVGSVSLGGRTKHAWRITVDDGSNVTIIRQTPPITSVTQSYTLTQGLSSLIQLVGSGLQARFHAGVGSEWLVTATTRPEQELGVVLANLDSIGGDIIDTLFGVGSPRVKTEPFLTFRNLWNNHPELPYRLGAMLLAWVLRADEIWRVQSQ